MLTNNQVNVICLAAILESQMIAEAIGFKHSTQEIKECSIQSLYSDQWNEKAKILQLKTINPHKRATSFETTFTRDRLNIRAAKYL